MFGHSKERFWTLLKFQIVFDFFFELFQVSTLQGELVNFFSRKNLKTSPKLVWTLLETCLGILNFEKFLHFFEIFRRLYPPGCTGQKIAKKSHQNMFGQSWKRFWTFLKIWILFDFCGTFSSLHGALGRVFFRRNNHATHDQTMFLGTFLENFESFEVFPLFCIFCRFRPPRVHWAKIFAEKITSKHVENMFDCFWERFFGQFEKLKVFPVFWNFSKFRPSRVNWSFFLTKKTTSEHVENLFEHFWERFWSFWKKK